jgi:predicted nucleic acid-binding protein
MALVVDAGALYAAVDADEPEHEAVAHVPRAKKCPLITSELAGAEADYLIG